MKEYIRSDLALEKKSLRNSDGNVKFHREKKIGNAVVTEIIFGENDNTAGGRYISVSYERLWELEGEEYEKTCTLIALELRKMSRMAAGKELSDDFGVLVAGLGNSEITADAIGPLTVKNLTVTRHLREMEPGIYSYLGTCEISALAPGVLGQTGIETVELIRGAVQNCEPDLVIAVDALAARSCERLASTVQLSDAGISPGSGIGNMRKAINSDTLGVPVVSIGVPTVVNSSTLVYEALGKAGIENIGTELERVLENGKSFFVTPKESDVISKRISMLLAESITRAFTMV